jgi:CubicO group peptidase (beta-lactamase class C family)
MDLVAQTMRRVTLEIPGQGGELVVIRGDDVLLDWSEAGNTPAGDRLVYCVGKPLAAIAAASLVRSGVLAYDAELSSQIPQLRGSMIGSANLRHLLTHTIPWTDRDPLVRLGKDFSNDDIWNGIAIEHLLGPPGSGAHYTTVTNWVILGALIEHATGLRFDQVIREHVTDRVDGAEGIRFRCNHCEHSPMRYISHEGGDPLVLDGASCEWTSGGFSIATGCRSSAKAIALVMQSFVASLNGRTGLVPRDVAAEMIKVHRTGMRDRFFAGGLGRGDPDWGLGFVKDKRLLGSVCSNQVFGHNGSNAASIIVDPNHSLVVAYVFDYMAPNWYSLVRRDAFLKQIYSTLGLIGKGRKNLRPSQ